MSTRCPRDGTPAPTQKSIKLLFVPVDCPEFAVRVGVEQVGLERMNANSLVPFQPFERGRNQFIHALIEVGRLIHSLPFNTSHLNTAFFHYLRNGPAFL